ncbi:MAG TPA: heat-inducible transcriptional repressor HrcA [Terriglobia bacterium]|nr:heat-inducible transcriptional repressor HrcA [Terriglobia bacterium]
MRDRSQLERRQFEVLAAVVRRYVATRTPVGSNAIAEDLNHAVSSATIRNTMAELEADGFLEQPHVSAGRIPTDQAYRLYVDRVAGASPLQPDVARYIHRSMGSEGVSPEQLMSRTSHLLSELSQNVGLVLAPAPSEKLLEHVKFVALPEHRVLAVIVSRPDVVENHVIRLEEEMPQAELDRAAEYLNAEFRGWSLRTVRLEIFKRMEEMKATCETLLTRVARLFSEGAIGQQDAGPLFLEGAAKILDQPEFVDARLMRELLETLDQKARLVQILTACLESSARSGVTILIGHENPAAEMRHCTLIVAPYSYRNRTVGALGVVGPTRMEYERAIQTVEYVAHLTSRLLSIN